jgi:phosphatidylglycerophosphate synthase
MDAPAVFHPGAEMTVASGIALAAPDRGDERRRALAYPISRWYVRPAAELVALLLAPTRAAPWWFTLGNLALSIAAAGVLWAAPPHAPVAAILILAAWFCDRTDGLLARRQSSATRCGAWLDANVDELGDVLLHVACASAATALTASPWPWPLLIAFLAGKYLFMYGLHAEESVAVQDDGAAAARPNCWLRRAYHLPGNADVRVHLLMLAVASGWITAELALVAVYYNLRWMARYALVVRRWGGQS